MCQDFLDISYYNDSFIVHLINFFIQISFIFDKSNIKTRRFILPIIILLKSVFILIQDELLSSSLLASSRENICFLSSSLKSSNNRQFFTFPDESLLVQLHLDVVRDTVCGLTLRTQTHSVTPAIEIGKYLLNLTQSIAGEHWPSISITIIRQKRLGNS